MNTDGNRSFRRWYEPRIAHKNILSSSVLICIYLWLILLYSCSTKPTDMRALAPADSLVYLETNDLAATLRPIVDSKPFNEAAKKKPDLSALQGVQLAVAVTGFETTEEKLTDEHSVGRVQPHFVAIADTHAWNYQAVSFAERKLGAFVTEIYDSEPSLEKADKHGGKYFTWTAKDGRKAYALVTDSVIYFGNDESAIDKCLAVRRGESDSVLKNGKVPPADPATLASGYVSTDGIAQIAALAGLQYATRSSEDEEVQSAVAGLLPQLIRGIVTDIRWRTSSTEKGYEDSLSFGLGPDAAAVFSETLASTSKLDAGLFGFVPAASPSVTLYDLAKPNVAWRGLLLTLSSKVDPLGARVIGEFANAFAEPYAIRDAEMFLSGVGSNIISVRADAEGEKPALIASVTNPQAVRGALSTDLKPDKAASDAFGLETLKNEDSMAVFAGSVVVIGDIDAVTACIRSRSDASGMGLAGLFRPGGTAVTYTAENEQTANIVQMLSAAKSDEMAVKTIVMTETRFNKNGIERKTTSDFGLIGSIIAQLAQD